VKCPRQDLLREPLKPHTGREVLGRHPRYVYRRFGGGCLRAGGPTPGGLRRNQRLASRRDLWASDGLFVDCIVPVMRGTPQPRRASKPLPQIKLQLVADCKAQNPRPAYCTAIASGSATWGGEPVPEDWRPRKWRRRDATHRRRKQSSRQCRRAHPSYPRPRKSRPRRGPITVVSAKSEFGEHPGTCHNAPNATGR
jgi:hypothetical protein